MPHQDAAPFNLARQVSVSVGDPELSLRASIHLVLTDAFEKSELAKRLGPARSSGTRDGFSGGTESAVRSAVMENAAGLLDDLPSSEIVVPVFNVLNGQPIRYLRTQSANYLRSMPAHRPTGGMIGTDLDIGTVETGVWLELQAISDPERKHVMTEVHFHYNWLNRFIEIKRKGADGRISDYVAIPELVNADVRASVAIPYLSQLVLVGPSFTMESEAEATERGFFGRHSTVRTQRTLVIVVSCSGYREHVGFGGD